MCLTPTSLWLSLIFSRSMHSPSVSLSRFRFIGVGLDRSLQAKGKTLYSSKVSKMKQWLKLTTNIHVANILYMNYKVTNSYKISQYIMQKYNDMFIISIQIHTLTVSYCLLTCKKEWFFLVSLSLLFYPLNRCFGSVMLERMNETQYPLRREANPISLNLFDKMS